MLGPWASAHRGKWGQLTHLEKWIKKIKSENMQKRAVFCVYVIFVVWLGHSVGGASVVGHVLGGGPHATRLAVATQQTARLLQR